MTTYTAMLPVHFGVPLLNPSPNGLYVATSWSEVGQNEPSRHLTGVEVRRPNYGGDNAGRVAVADGPEPTACPVLTNSAGSAV